VAWKDKKNGLNLPECSQRLQVATPSRIASLSKPIEQIRKIRSVVTELLPAGHPTLVMVATQMEISPRSLQRRLADNGLTHSQLVYQTRLAKACQLLAQQDIQINEIAGEIGFATPSAFSRAFHTWTGLSPRAFRNGLIELALVEK
jgi:AraC-like DNA-binding protein